MKRVRVASVLEWLAIEVRAAEHAPRDVHRLIAARATTFTTADGERLIPPGCALQGGAVVRLEHASRALLCPPN